MRIRQVRPEYFTDPVTARLSVETRLLYVGLWIVADDAGWFRWNVAQLGALLMPYDPPKRREAHIARAGQELVDAGRLVLRDCGCGEIPTLPKHQRVTGKQSFGARDAHGKRCLLNGKQSLLSESPGTELGTRNGRELGTERNGTVEARVKEILEYDDELRVTMAAQMKVPVT